MLRPEIVELVDGAPAPVNVRIVATVTLDGASRSVETAVSVFPVRVPSVLALFRNRAFSAADYGAALLVVPGNSPVSSVAGVRSAVAQLHAAAERLSVFARFAALAGRVAALLTALRTHDHVAFVRTDALTDLHTITLIPRGVLANDIKAEDEVSSLILLGPAGRRARLFIHRGFDQAGGRLDVGVEDENAVLIADLGSTETVPAGRAQVIVDAQRPKSFDDTLSSVQLAKPAFRATLAGDAVLGADTVAVELGLAFNGTHRHFGIDSFVGSVSLAGPASGTFDPATGATTLSCASRWAHPRSRSSSPAAWTWRPARSSSATPRSCRSPGCSTRFPRVLPCELRPRLRRRESERLHDQAGALVELLHGDTHYPAGARVLEAGCGTGAQSVTLSARSPKARFTSIDVSAESLAVARRRELPNVEFRQADLFTMPPETFDHVFVCFVLEHLPDPVGGARAAEDDAAARRHDHGDRGRPRLGVLPPRDRGRPRGDPVPGHAPARRGRRLADRPPAVPAGARRGLR